VSKKYTGVTYHRKLGKYESRVTYSGITYKAGWYDTEIEAVRTRDLLIIKKGLPVKLQILKPISQIKKTE
jgi:hypothetical protein